MVIFLEMTFITCDFCYPFVSTVWLDSIIDSVDEFQQTPGDSERLRKLGIVQSKGLQRVGHD